MELEALRYDNKFLFKIIVDERVDREVRIPSMIIQPFLENAIWHGLLHKEGQGTLQIEIFIDHDNALVCGITDNGIGRKKAETINTKSTTNTKSFGINITHERLRIINGDFHTEDLIKITDLYNIHGDPEGTFVEIKLKRSVDD